MHKIAHKPQFSSIAHLTQDPPVMAVTEDPHCEKCTSSHNENRAENESARFKNCTNQAAHKHKRTNNDTIEISLFRSPHSNCYIFLTFMVLNVMYF
jgi:hypothetical protein